MAEISSGNPCSDQANTIRTEKNMEKNVKETTKLIADKDKCKHSFETEVISDSEVIEVGEKLNTQTELKLHEEKIVNEREISIGPEDQGFTEIGKVENFSGSNIDEELKADPEVKAEKIVTEDEKLNSDQDIKVGVNACEEYVTKGTKVSGSKQDQLEVVYDEATATAETKLKALSFSKVTSKSDLDDDKVIVMPGADCDDQLLSEATKISSDEDTELCEKMKVNLDEVSEATETKTDLQHRNMFLEDEVLNGLQPEKEDVKSDDSVDGKVTETAPTTSKETSVADLAGCCTDSSIANVKKPSYESAVESETGDSEKDSEESDTDLTFQADEHKLMSSSDGSLADDERTLKDLDSHSNSMMNFSRTQGKTKNMDETGKNGYFLKVTVQNKDYEISGSNGESSISGELSDDEDTDCSFSESDGYEESCKVTSKPCSVGSKKIRFPVIPDSTDEIEEENVDYGAIHRCLKCLKYDDAKLFVISGRKENKLMEIALNENFVLHPMKQRSNYKLLKYCKKRRRRKCPVLLAALKDLSDSQVAIFSNDIVHVPLRHFQRNVSFNKKWQGRCKTKNRRRSKHKTNNNINCPLCCRKRLPELFCEECCMFGCKGCISDLHSLLTSFSDHVILSVDFRFHCRCHRDLYKYFCNVCKVPLCEKKMLSKHLEHSVQTLADYVSEQREHLEKSAKNVSEYCLNKTDLCLTEIEEQKENLELSWIREKEVVQLEFASLRDMLVEQENAILSEMEKGFHTSKERLKSTAQVLGDVIQQEAKLTSQTMKVLSDPSKYNFLFNGEHVKEKWSKLKDYTQALPCQCDTSLEPFSKKLPISLYKEKCEIYRYLRAYIHDLDALLSFLSWKVRHRFCFSGNSCNKCKQRTASTSEVDRESSDPCSETFKFLTQNDLFTKEKQSNMVKQTFSGVKPKKQIRRNLQKDQRHIPEKSEPCKVTSATKTDTAKTKMGNSGDKSVESKSTTKTESTLKFSKLRIQNLFKTTAIDTSKFCSSLTSTGITIVTAACTPVMTSSSTATMNSSGTTSQTSAGTPPMTLSNTKAVTSATTPIRTSIVTSAVTSTCTPTAMFGGTSAVTSTRTPTAIFAATPAVTSTRTPTMMFGGIPAVSSVGTPVVTSVGTPVVTSVGTPALTSVGTPTTAALKISADTLSSIASSLKFHSEQISKSVASSSKFSPAKPCALTFSSTRSSPPVKCSVKKTTNSGSVTQAQMFNFGPPQTKASSSTSALSISLSNTTASNVTVSSAKSPAKTVFSNQVPGAKLNFSSALHSVGTSTESKVGFRFLAPSNAIPSSTGSKKPETTSGNTAHSVPTVGSKVVATRGPDLCRTQQTSNISLPKLKTDTCNTSFKLDLTLLKPSYNSLRVRPLKLIVISDSEKPLKTTDLWNPPSGALSRAAHWEYSFEVRDGTKTVLWSRESKFREGDFVLNSVSLFKLQSPNSYVLKVIPHYVVELSTSEDITTGKPTLILLFTNQQSMDQSELLPTEFHANENHRQRSLRWGNASSFEEERFHFYLNKTIHQRNMGQRSSIF